MTAPDLSRYRTAAQHVALLRREATGLLHEYLHGYRLGMARTTGEPAPGQWEPTPDDEAGEDRSRAARALGLADGRAWAEGRRSGLVRLVARQLGVSHRVLAEEYLVRDERTVRRWVSGAQVPPASVTARLLRLLGEEPPVTDRCRLAP